MDEYATFYCQNCWTEYLNDQEFIHLIEKQEMSQQSKDKTIQKKKLSLTATDDNKSKIIDHRLIFAYLAVFENKTKLLCPLDVKRLIIIFCYSGDTFFKFGSALRIDGIFNEKCIRDKSVKGRTIQNAFGSRKVSSGDHFWRFRINKMCSGHHYNMAIGIIDSCVNLHDRLYKDFYGSYFAAYAFIGGSGDVHSTSNWYGGYTTSISSNYAPKLNTGDIIEMHLNFQDFSLRFVINGVNYGKTKHKVLKDTTYRMAVSFSGGPNEIELLGYNANL